MSKSLNPNEGYWGESSKSGALLRQVNRMTMSSSSVQVASHSEGDELPFCGCFGQTSPRAKSRPATPRVNTDGSPVVKATEPDIPGGWTIGAEQPAALCSPQFVSSSPDQLGRLPSGAEELHEVKQSFVASEAVYSNVCFQIDIKQMD